MIYTDPSTLVAIAPFAQDDIYCCSLKKHLNRHMVKLCKVPQAPCADSVLSVFVFLHLLIGYAHGLRRLVKRAMMGHANMLYIRGDSAVNGFNDSHNINIWLYITNMV